MVEEKKETKFKVGDTIVDFGKVYKIFEIKDNNCFFRPLFPTRANEGLICSIPLKSLEETDIRRPIDKKELKKLLAQISKPIKRGKRVNINRNRGIMVSNDIEKTIEFVRRLWSIKKDESRNFTTTKKDAFRILMRRLSEEIALVYHQTPQEAEKAIERRLKRVA